MGRSDNKRRNKKLINMIETIRKENTDIKQAEVSRRMGKCSSYYGKLVNTMRGGGAINTSTLLEVLEAVQIDMVFEEK